MAMLMGDEVEGQVFITNCVATAAFTILYYDYALTFHLEVNRFWKMRRLTWASSLFYLNRYLSLVGHIPVIVQYFLPPMGSQRFMTCMVLSSFHQYLAIIVQAIVGVFQVMRTYALYDQKLSVLLSLCSSGSVAIIYGIWAVMRGQGLKYTEEDLPMRGCLPPLSEAMSFRLASAWTAMLAFDVIIFVMTLYKSITRKREGDSTILHVIIRDGAIYFGVIMVAALSVILSFRLSPPHGKGLTTTLTNIISSTMVSRIMLNLRNPKLSTTFRSDSTASQEDAIFTSVVDTEYSGKYSTRLSEDSFA